MVSEESRAGLGLPAIARASFLLLIPFGLALALWLVHPDLIMDVDSASYLTGSPARTATYPLFLDLFYGPALLPVQLLLFAASLSWLAFYSSKFLPWLASAAMMLLIAANPYVWQLQATILSEALTTPLLTVVVGCVLGFVATRRPALIVIAAFLCGVATAIRPSMLPFIVTALCALWIGPKIEKPWTILAVTALAWIAPLVAERAYSRAAHGRELTSFIGRNIFMKGAVIDGPPLLLSSNDPVDRRLTKAVNEDYEPVRRLIDQVSDRDVRYILMTNYEACAGYPCGDSFVKGFGLSETELERHMMKIGVARLKSNPIAYLKLAATEYQRLWLLHPRKHPDLAPKYNAFLAREAPIPFQSLFGPEAQPTPASEQKQILRVNRAAFALIGIVGVAMTILFAFWRPGKRVEAAFLLLLGTQAVLVFSTFVGVGQPRYAMGMWPALIAGELLGIVGLVEWWKPPETAREAGMVSRREDE
jgi:hypothetical protein